MTHEEDMAELDRRDYLREKAGRIRDYEEMTERTAQQIAMRVADKNGVGRPTPQKEV